MYEPHIEYKIIESDIKKLLMEQFDEDKFKRLLDPPMEYFWPVYL